MTLERFFLQDIKSPEIFLEPRYCKFTSTETITWCKTATKTAFFIKNKLKIEFFLLDLENKAKGWFLSKR